MQVNCYPLPYRPTKQSCNDERPEGRIYKGWCKMHGTIALLKRKEHLRQIKWQQIQAAASDTPANMARIHQSQNRIQVRSWDCLPFFYGLIINGCIYKKMDIYKGSRVICVLDHWVTSEAVEGYSALGIIARHQISALPCIWYFTQLKRSWKQPRYMQKVINQLQKRKIHTSAYIILRSFKLQES